MSDCGSCEPTGSSSSMSSSSSGTPATEPQPTWKFMSEVCKDGLSPYRIQGIMVQLMVMHWCRPELIYNPNLRDKVWTRDPRTTKIWITTVSRWDPRSQMIRPAIIVKRKPFSQNRISIGDKYTNLVDHMEFAREVSGSHQFLCIGRSGPEAEDVAYEIEEYLTTFANLFVNEFGFVDFECKGLGELTPLEEDKTNFVVPIEVTYKYVWKWKLVKVGPMWKTTELKANA